MCPWNRAIFYKAWRCTGTQFNATCSSVVEQWIRYPEVVGSIPDPFQLIINSQISWEYELTIQSKYICLDHLCQIEVLIVQTSS